MKMGVDTIRIRYLKLMKFYKLVIKEKIVRE